MAESDTRFGLFFIVAVAMGLSIVHLDGWPPPWYDEGLFLQAAKNVVLHGRYGLDSSEGFRAFDPLIGGAGPTLTLPIAGVFKVFGIGLLQARFVTVAYSVAALTFFYLLAEALWDKRTALVATLLLLATPFRGTDLSASYLPLSRMAMGEIHSLAFIVAGLWCWLRGVAHNRPSLLLAAALLFSFMAVAKPQNMVFLSAFVLAGTVDRFTYRRVALAYWLIPSLTIGIASMTWRYLPHALGTYSTETAQALREVTGLQAMFGFIYPERILENARTLASSGTPLLAAPGVAYGILRLRQSREEWQLMLPLAFCVTGAFWFIFASIGWLRYAFPVLALANLFVAPLLVDGLRTVGRVRSNTLSLGAYAAVGILVLLALRPAIVNIATPPEKSAQRFARYLDGNVAPGAVIECFEAEIPFLSDRQFHQPPLDSMIVTVRHVRLREPYDEAPYDFGPHDPAYLIDGPFSRLTEIYGVDLAGRYEHVVTIGAYSLYRLGQLSATASERGADKRDDL